MNSKRAWMLALGLALAALFALNQIILIVHEGEAVVMTTFGRPAANPLTEPGLYVRWPWPVQAAHRMDTRWHTLEGPLEQTLTKDGRTVIVALFAGWRVEDPIAFLLRVGTESAAERNLAGLLANARNTVLGEHPFSALVNTDASALMFDDIERRILELAREEARRSYGIELTAVGIRRLGLPESITEQVYRRMRAERNAVAEGFRAEGAREAARIRAEADREREERIAQAEAEARRIRAEGEAEAADAYRAFAEDPEFAMFLRKLDVLEEVLGERATVVLGSEAEPFDLLSAPSADTTRAGKDTTP
ncbi:MAG: protease modulator HflC [Kiritimatiellae bacterium]|nr:protease modulator HflC [Kiritimatiellia bacterium]